VLLTVDMHINTKQHIKYIYNPKKALCIVSAIVTVDAYINKKTKTQRVTYIFIYKKTSV